MATIQLLHVSGVTTREVQAVVPSYRPGRWIEYYDATVGLESLICTPYRADALQLSMVEAIELVKSSPPNHPVRETDGEPNRPLTSFTLAIDA